MDGGRGRRRCCWRWRSSRTWTGKGGRGGWPESQALLGGRTAWLLQEPVRVLGRGRASRGPPEVEVDGKPSGKLLPLRHVPDPGSVRRSPGELGVQVGHRWRVASPFLSRDAYPDLHEDLTFVVHSKPHAEFVIDTGNELMPELRSLIGSTRLEERRANLAFDPRMAGYGRSGRAPLPKDWFNDIEIIVLERRLRGHVTRGFAWELDAWPGIAPVRIDREGRPLQR